MAADVHPREIVKLLLQGAPPPRPLLLPIVFALGAKIENLPFASFLGNPTKICNALRQIRGYLRTDGVSCYFDPYLELEILGARLQRSAADAALEISWPGRATIGELPEALNSVEDALRNPRVAAAVDVIRRMNTMLRDQPLLMAGVTGPLTLAGRLTQASSTEPLRIQNLPAAATEMSSAIFAGLSRTFVEAGANVIFVQEDVCPILSDDARATWISELESTCNVIRFYEALPILLLNNDCWLEEEFSWMFAHSWNCVVSPIVKENSVIGTRKFEGSSVGLALAPALFSSGVKPVNDTLMWLRECVQAIRPAVITTSGDVPASVDVKALAQVLNEASRP